MIAVGRPLQKELALSTEEGKLIRVDELTVEDIRARPVWQFTSNDEKGELAVRAVKRLPVQDTTGKLFGNHVKLANGYKVWAIIGNVDATNARLTRHFLTLSVEQGGSWFTLARYHDLDGDSRGPAQLASRVLKSADRTDFSNFL